MISYNYVMQILKTLGLNTLKLCFFYCEYCSTCNHYVISLAFDSPRIYFISYVMLGIIFFFWKQKIISSYDRIWLVPYYLSCYVLQFHVIINSFVKSFQLNKVDTYFLNYVLVRIIIACFLANLHFFYWKWKFRC